MHSEEHGAVVIGGDGVRYFLEEGRVEGEDPLARFAPTAAQHLLRTNGFAHAPDLLIGSFYDPALDEGCAFEELISFHGGLGGPQTRPFVLYPAELPAARGADRRSRGRFTACSPAGGDCSKMSRRRPALAASRQ